MDMRCNIADFKTTNSRYGPIDDVEELIVELKKRGMKLIMDSLETHTSDEVSLECLNINLHLT